MSDETLRRAFGGAKTPVVVVAAGPETFLREQAARDAAFLFLGAADSPDVVVVQPDDAVESASETAARFLGEVRTRSLFGGRKLVVLRDADDVVAAAKAGFVAWLGATAESVVGVLLAVELPAEVVTAARAAGVVVACGGRGGANEPPAAFAKRRVAERGKKLSATDASLLVERVGEELSAIDNAVELLCLHAGDADVVSSDDIDALLRSARDGVVFEFGDLLAEGEIGAALTEAQRCFAEGVPEDFAGERVTYDERRIAQKLLLAFVSSATRGLALRRQLDAGVARSELQFAGPSFKGFLPWKAKERLVRNATRRRAEAFEALLMRAEETERGTKSGGADGRLAIARLATLAGMVK